MDVRGMYKEYWGDKNQRALQASMHTAVMEKEYLPQIESSIESSRIYEGDFRYNRYAKDGIDAIRELLPITSTDAVFYAQDGNSKIAVLNFASYKNPGGKFIEGSIAQEESLCHSSILYNVLKRFDGTYYEYNRKHLNRSLYYNRGIYSPNIVFFNRNKETCFADVITCAAPNIGAARKYCGVRQSENHEVLHSRCMFVLDMAEDNNVDTLILGAFGCGVFRQDPYMVANMFESCLNMHSYHFKKVIYAIPDSGHGIDNYKAFCNVIN